MRINTNVMALNAIEATTRNNNDISSSLEKLSSGLRINKASDDASGLAIADKLRTQGSTISQSISNANSANSLIQIADKAMSEQSNILDVVKTKLIQASTSTTSADGRQAIGKDVNALLIQLDNIASSTSYNGITLLQLSSTDKSSASTLDFQIGDQSHEKVTITGPIQSNTVGLAASSPTDDMSNLKTDSIDTSVFTASKAFGYVSVVDLAITDLNDMRSKFGASQNQIESSLRNMMTAKTNVKAAESIIRDVDYASESANFSKLNVIGQASSYALSQANAIPKNVLKLLP